MKIDKNSAKELHPNNRQRVLRAIAIYESTGIRKSETLARQNHELVYDARFIGLTLEREVLYERINQRVDLMMKQGLLQEIDDLMKKKYSNNLQSMKAIGYKEWFNYYKGIQTLDETLELIKKILGTMLKDNTPGLITKLQLNGLRSILKILIKQLKQLLVI